MANKRAWQILIGIFGTVIFLIVFHFYSMHQYETRNMAKIIAANQELVETEIFQQLDSEKIRIETIEIDYDKATGSYVSSGDAGGIPYPKHYQLQLVVYVNQQKYAPVHVFLDFPYVITGRLRITQEDPFRDLSNFHSVEITIDNQSEAQQFYNF